MSKVSERSGLGKKAKRRAKLLMLADRYEAEGDADTAQRYRQLSADIRADLRSAGACLRCGRRLADPDAEYGQECAIAAAAAAGEHDGQTD